MERAAVGQVRRVDIADKAVVVTGGASGIGLAIAEACGELGARVALADIEEAALEAAQSLLADRGVTAIVVQTDVRHADQLERLRDEVDREFGGADIVCNNAGILPPAAMLWDTPVRDLEWAFSVNLWGIVHGVRAFVPGMIERGSPAYIVNTASMAGLGGSPLYAGYGMTKAAVVSLSNSLRDELQAVGAPIGVSVLLPEMISTRLAYAERNRGDATVQIAEDPELDVFRIGLDPAVVGDRVVSAIREDRFWILPPGDDQFMAAAVAWMDGIKESAS